MRFPIRTVLLSDRNLLAFTDFFDTILHPEQIIDFLNCHGNKYNNFCTDTMAKEVIGKL